MEQRAPRLADWERVTLGYCILLGLTWTFLASWVSFTWDIGLPALSPLGVLKAMLLWPAWGVVLLGSGLDHLGVTGLDIWLPGALVGTALGALLGVSVLIWLRHSP